MDRGIYAPHFGGGQVDITSGKFVFSTSEAYLIEKGKITKPVKGATIIGSGIDVMQKVSMVADKTDLDLGIGSMRQRWPKRASRRWSACLENR